MRRILVLCLSGTALATAGWAEDTSPSPILVPAAPSSSAPSAAAAPAAPASAPARAATGDKDLNAMLSAGMPAYAPPPPPPKPKAETDADADAPDLRDVDKPKNQILRLPKYMVHAAKPPIFRERDLYTPDGIARLALLRYQGLSVVPLPNLNGGVATEMYNENERLQNMASLEDTAREMQSGGDKDEAKMIREASSSTYQQSLDWFSTAGVPQNPSAYGANGLH